MDIRSSVPYLHGGKFMRRGREDWRNFYRKFSTSIRLLPA